MKKLFLDSQSCTGCNYVNAECANIPHCGNLHNSKGALCVASPDANASMNSSEASSFQTCDCFTLDSPFESSRKVNNASSQLFARSDFTPFVLPFWLTG